MKILGIGNAIVDVLCEVNEKFLENYCYDPLLHRQLIKTTKFQNKILGEINTIPGVNNAL